MHFDPLESLPFRTGPYPVLLCEHIRTPTVPRSSIDDGGLTLLWIKGDRTLSSSGSVSKTDGTLSDCQVSEGTQAESSELLFRAAHRFLLIGDVVMADRCLQKAITLQSGAGAADDFPSPASSWLVLATSSLLGNDLDSCETWLHQAERSMHTFAIDVNSESFQIAAGDLFAIQACLFAQTRHWRKSEKLLLEAFRCHMQAGVYESAVRDLILKARVLVQRRKWQEADALLVEAATLANSLTKDMEVLASSTMLLNLIQVINRDHSLVRKSEQAFRIAQMN